ncbi:GNAT family N-acetyltransferase [Rhizohabitans arisaemae]|uniref:GNAT family N-acetyltransferase n=1 Tax=Rhizohabitans arisaemae TaxID=2720610 RepID=UPI0024B0EDE3|nr:GNAT family N-acetyltransferase [Rhizohabitans arisaemae]
MTEVREITSFPELIEAVGGDPLPLWVGQGLAPGHRAFALGGALAVSGADVARANRLAIVGPPADAARLLPEALARTGHRFQPIGDAALIRELAARVPGVGLRAEFGWMQTSAAPGAARTPTWLGSAADPEVTRFLDEVYPASYARPGIPGVRRWAGLREPDGKLIAIAADAWSAPTLGFLAGVAVAPGSRGSGHGARMCAGVLAELVEAYGTAALAVDEWNTGAIRMYRRLGLVYRPVAVAEANPA